MPTTAEEMLLITSEKPLVQVSSSTRHSGLAQERRSTSFLPEMK